MEVMSTSVQGRMRASQPIHAVGTNGGASPPPKGALGPDEPLPRVTASLPTPRSLHHAPCAMRPLGQDSQPAASGLAALCARPSSSRPPSSALHRRRPGVLHLVRLPSIHSLGGNRCWDVATTILIAAGTWNESSGIDRPSQNIAYFIEPSARTFHCARLPQRARYGTKGRLFRAFVQ